MAGAGGTRKAGALGGAWHPRAHRTDCVAGVCRGEFVCIYVCVPACMAEQCLIPVANCLLSSHRTGH